VEPGSIGQQVAGGELYGSAAPAGDRAEIGDHRAGRQGNDTDPAAADDRCIDCGGAIGDGAAGLQVDADAAGAGPGADDRAQIVDHPGPGSDVDAGAQPGARPAVGHRAGAGDRPTLGVVDHAAGAQIDAEAQIPGNRAGVVDDAFAAGDQHAVIFPGDPRLILLAGGPLLTTPPAFR
jgi:hypothetical protein